MTAPSLQPAASGTSVAGAVEVRPSPPQIDLSCSSPILFMFASAAVWLALGTFLTLIVSIKLHQPAFLSGTAWLTFGRVRPAGMDALLYGFASQAGMAMIIWLSCRLGAVTLCCRGPLIVAAMFWNLGVTVGVLGVLAGLGTGFSMIDMPVFANAILFASYAVIGVCSLVTFNSRENRTLYASQWYLLGALFWFPWAFSAANLLLNYWPLRGVLQPFIASWFSNNLLMLWLGSIALAALFYFLPKLLNRPLYSNYLAAFGFWTYVLFAGWTGSTQLLGGPLPSWMIAIGTSASVLLIAPTIAVAFNWYKTISGARFAGRDVANTVLRFTLFGAVAFLMASGGQILLGCPRISSITQFSFVPLALTYLFIFGAFGMTAFAAIYYIVPRAARIEWPEEKLVRLHYNCSAIGVGLLFLSLLIGGLIQGYRLNQTTIEVAQVTRGTIPFVGMATLGFLALLIGQIAFLKNLFTLLHRQGSPVRAAAVELFIPEPARAGGKP